MKHITTPYIAFLIFEREINSNLYGITKCQLKLVDVLQ